jgi:hypothetical protein
MTQAMLGHICKDKIKTALSRGGTVSHAPLARRDKIARVIGAK